MPLFHVVNSAEDAAKMAAFIAQHKPPFTVSISEGGEKRRDRQNRFSHETYRQVARILGDRSQEDVRAESKLVVGLPILRLVDLAFNAQCREMIDPLPYAWKMKMMVGKFDFAVTRSMNISQMNEYITALLRYWDENGAPGAMLERYDL